MATPLVGSSRYITTLLTQVTHVRPNENRQLAVINGISLSCPLPPTLRDHQGRKGRETVKVRGWGGPGKNSVSWAWQNFYTCELMVAMCREQKALYTQLSTGEAREGKQTAHLFHRRRHATALPGTGNDEVLQPGDPLPSDETGSALCPRICVFTYPRTFSLNLERCFYSIKPLS